VLFSDFLLSVILDQDAVAPASRQASIALPVGLRRDGVARAGGHLTASPAWAFANLVAADGGQQRPPGRRGSAVVAALIIATVVGLGFGAIASRSEGIYFLMITLAFSVLSLLLLLAGHEPLGLRRPSSTSSCPDSSAIPCRIRCRSTT
jgi:hypothetical protein